MATKHDTTAQRIAKKKGVDYNRGQGPDVQTPRQIIEVETLETLKDAARQLQGFRKPVYVAGSNETAAEAALEYYKDTTIGVMDPQGNILKRSTRNRK